MCFMEFTSEKTSHILLPIQVGNLDWFPHLRCMSLSIGETENEQNEIRNLHAQLAITTDLVKTLSTQLNELREQVCIVCISRCRRKVKFHVNFLQRSFLRQNF